jgi:hypothetical protein
MFNHQSDGPQTQLLTLLRPCGPCDVFLNLRRRRNVYRNLQLHSRMLNHVSYDSSLLGEDLLTLLACVAVHVRL